MGCATSMLATIWDHEAILWITEFSVMILEDAFPFWCKI